MRVIAGTAKSMPLKCPDGMDTRPTQDRVKETLFNMLQPFLVDGVFVDFFSGSGAIGIEALSRGAKKAYFVENSRKAIAVIEENLNFTKLADNAVLLKIDVLSSLHHIFEKEIDCIFMDPPYDLGLEKQLLEALSGVKFVTDETLIVVEASLQTEFSYLESMGLEVFKEKKYKTNQHVFIRKIVKENLEP